MTPTTYKIPDSTPSKEEASLCLVSLAPMKLVSPILKPPFLLPATTYYFIEDRVVALKLTKAVQTLLIWIWGYLVDAAPGIAVIGALDLEDRLVSGRRKTLRDLVPEALLLQQANTTYVMQAAPSVPMPPVPSKKEVMIDERWELQKLSLYRLCNVNGI